MPPMTSRSLRTSHSSTRARLAQNERGALFVEYAVLVALVGLVLSLMLVTLGPSVVREYSARRATLYSHHP